MKQLTCNENETKRFRQKDYALDIVYAVKNRFWNFHRNITNRTMVRMSTSIITIESIISFVFDILMWFELEATVVTEVFVPNRR